MRIIGGRYKGRNVYMPGWIRPTQAIVRKALFDILGQKLNGLSFLDLFAGSGAVGFEALSRGAQKVVLVEKDPRCAAVIEENQRLLLEQQRPPDADLCELMNQDAYAAIKYLCRQKQSFDIVFLDPPYGEGLAKKALKTLDAYDILHPNSQFIIQHNLRETLPASEGRFLIFRERKFGNSIISFYRKTKNGNESGPLSGIG